MEVFSWENHLFLWAIFHGYVKQPECNLYISHHIPSMSIRLEINSLPLNHTYLSVLNLRVDPARMNQMHSWHSGWRRFQGQISMVVLFQDTFVRMIVVNGILCRYKKKQSTKCIYDVRIKVVVRHNDIFIYDIVRIRTQGFVNIFPWS